MSAESSEFSEEMKSEIKKDKSGSRYPDKKGTEEEIAELSASMTHGKHKYRPKKSGHAAEGKPQKTAEGKDRSHPDRNTQKTGGKKHGQSVEKEKNDLNAQKTENTGKPENGNKPEHAAKAENGKNAEKVTAPETGEKTADSVKTETGEKTADSVKTETGEKTADHVKSENTAETQTGKTSENAVSPEKEIEPEKSGETKNGQTPEQTGSEEKDRKEDGPVRKSSRYPEKKENEGTDGVVQDIRVGKDKKENKQEEKIVSVHDRKNGRLSDPQIDAAKEAEEHRETVRKRIRAGLTAACAVLVICYIVTAVYFGSHFYQNTEIFGINCSQKTIEEVKEEVADKLDTYVLTIKERGGVEETLTAEDIGLEFEDNNSIDKMLKKQYSFLWPIMSMLKQKDITSIGFSYDREKTAEALLALDCFDESRIQKPRDAFLNVTENGYQVEKEIQGNELDPEKTLAAVNRILDAGQMEVSLDDQNCYETPGVYQDDEALNAEAEAKNAVTQARIRMDFGDTIEKIDAEVMDDWLILLDNGTYVVDNMCVEEYVNELADKYDTFGLPHVFRTVYDTELTLYDGDYGWMMARDDTTLKIMKAINEGYQGDLEPEYVFTAMHKGKNDIGDTYVEINIEEQRMLLFKNGECIIDTPVVTGNPSRGNATPTGGVWAIDAKMRDYTLVGPGYRVPVDYWLPFNGNVGIHDLQSRGAFGGSIYLYAGSHGCVNTPYDAVSVIYENVSIGTPVIVYASPYDGT